MAATILPPYQPPLALTAQMLNSPLATASVVVQVTGRLAPWARLVVPAGAVTVMSYGGHPNVARIV